MRRSLSVLAILAVFPIVFAGNILFLNGVPLQSHHLWNNVLVKGLAGKGHKVTFVSVEPGKEVNPNVLNIHVEKTYESFFRANDSLENVLQYVDEGAIKALIELPKKHAAVCEGVLNSRGLDEILSYPDTFKFDAVIYDFTFGPCLLPILTKLNYPPLIAVSAFANPPYSSDLIGGQKYPSYIPHYNVKYTTEMTFRQRLHNTLTYFFDWITREYLFYPKLEEITRKRFNFSFPPLKELSQKTVLMLINTDIAIDFPEPLQPNMIQVGGLQIVEPKPLKDELLYFVESGKKGTILMSLGTNMKSKNLGEERLTTILKTFAELLEYNFLWKFEAEEENLPIKPSKNVMVKKFLPQNDILAHSNLKAFVSHGGLLSTHEALYHGKAIVGMPFFVDQRRNVAKLSAMNVGVQVDFRDLNVRTFKSAIEKVLNDHSFIENAKKISKLFKDKPQKPLETAIWWVEYVMRNPNMDHMKSPTLKFGPFVSKSYDVLLAVFIFPLILGIFVIKIGKFTLYFIEVKRKID